MPQVDPARMGVVRRGATAVPPRLRSVIPTRADRSYLRLRYPAPTGASPMATGDAATYAHPRARVAGARKLPPSAASRRQPAPQRNRPWPRVSRAPARIETGGAFLRSRDAQGRPPAARPREKLKSCRAQTTEAWAGVIREGHRPKGGQSVRVRALGRLPTNDCRHW